ncbi:MAG: cytochrome c oxidase polypeptide [Thermoleophilia bacterium]|nr:cytochrome c oxidase polypeptide [Thermoleophilia bacterium]
MASHAVTSADLHHDDEHPPAVVWSAKTPINLMGMLFFIGSEIALFGSFFMSYFFIRVAGSSDYSSWSEQIGHILPLKVVTLNSLVLFSSSVTVHYAEIALMRGARRWQAIWIALTALLGFSFLAIQINEYRALLTDDQVGPSTSAFSSIFFSLTGLHGSHVLVGGILLLVMLVRTLRGHYGPEPEQHIGFRTMSIYWHFVDLVWVFVFGLIYIPGNWDRWGNETVLFGLSGPVVFFSGAAIIIVLLNVPRLIGKGAPKH